MEGVRPRLSYDIDLAAAIVSVLRVEVVGDDAEFRNGVEIGNDRRAVVFALFHVRSVNHETVGRLTLSVDGLISSIQTAIYGPVVEAGSACIRGAVRGNSRLQRQQ